jgi:uncharacterized membrane protein
MSSYFVLKALHIISAAVLFGTGLGIAFFKWVADRTGNAVAIRVVSEKVVLADWLFTLPAIVVQAVTGLALARMLGIRCRVAGWLGHLRRSAWRGFARFQSSGCRFRGVSPFKLVEAGD